MRTQSSRLYAATRIPGHDVQFAATARVILYFVARYGLVLERRHQARILLAIQRLTR